MLKVDELHELAVNRRSIRGYDFIGNWIAKDSSKQFTARSNWNGETAKRG